MGQISRIMFAAPKSGSGKTMVTCGFLQACRKRGLQCRSYKCGPDYIDPMFHREVLGVPGGNLDSFFEPESALRTRLALQPEADITVLEGVMGYYDGLGGISDAASSYEVAAAVKTPVILVVDGKGSSLSLAAELMGFLHFRKDNRIAGVILNRFSPQLGELLRPELSRMGIRLLGCIPERREAVFESRHLGLVMPEEYKDLKQQMEKLGNLLEQYTDIDGILEIGRQAEDLTTDRDMVPGEPIPVRLTHPYRMGIARDAAFCFYYQENLEMLEQMGVELLPFSPLCDEHLPAGCDGILLGGGYPELYAKQLSDNGLMRKDILDFAKQGGQILAECGGFLYLHRSLVTAEGQSFPMTGVVDGEGFPAGKLSRFGYVQLECGGMPWMKAHEFHYWDSTAPGGACTARKPVGTRSWQCMYRTDRMWAGFPHLYYRSNPESLYRWLEQSGQQPAGCVEKECRVPAENPEGKQVRS